MNKTQETGLTGIVGGKDMLSIRKHCTHIGWYKLKNLLLLRALGLIGTSSCGVMDNALNSQSSDCISVEPVL